MDPFSSSEPVDESLLRRQLHSFQYQVTKELEDASLEPMDFKEMILRTARNVRFSVEWHVTQLSTDVDPFFAVRTPFEPARDQLRGDPSLELTYTEYAAIWASVLMNSDRRREPLHTLCGVIDARFPMDSKLLEREVRSRDEHMYALEPILAAMKMKQDRDLMAQVPKRRSTAGTGEQVPFRIGQLIRHRRYEYQGVIYGWDTACEMNEAWQARMHIHDLPGGSQQSFYQVL